MASFKGKKEPLSQKAYRTIKNMILNHELSQGEFISEADLQEKLCIGRTPVREAVLQLSQDQLIRIHPRKGIEIARISPKTIRDIFEIRSILEPVALRKGIDKLDKTWLRDIRDQFVRYNGDDIESISKEDAIHLADLDNQFHIGLIRVMGNRYADNLMQGFVDFLVLIRSTVTTSDIPRFQDSNKEHIEIIDFILAGDVEQACQKLSEHIRISYNEAIRTILDIL